MKPIIYQMSEGLTQEEKMFAAVAQTPLQRYLSVWRAHTPSLVVPRKYAVASWFDTAKDDLNARGWPIFMRATGGDITPQGPGIVNVSHIYTVPAGAQFSLDREYDRLCTPIEMALGGQAKRGWQRHSFCDGAYNVVCNGQKFAGTALRIRRAKADPSRMVVLAHALMLIERPAFPAISAINVFLEYAGRPPDISLEAHTSLPSDLSEKAFLERLCDEFTAMTDLGMLRSISIDA